MVNNYTTVLLFSNPLSESPSVTTTHNHPIIEKSLKCCTFFSFSLIFTYFFIQIFFLECNVQRCILILTGLVQSLFIYLYFLFIYLFVCLFIHSFIYFMYVFMYLLYMEDMNGTMNSTTMCIASDMTGLRWNMYVPYSRWLTTIMTMTVQNLKIDFQAKVLRNTGKQQRHNKRLSLKNVVINE